MFIDTLYLVRRSVQKLVQVVIGDKEKSPRNDYEQTHFKCSKRSFLKIYLKKCIFLATYSSVRRISSVRAQIICHTSIVAMILPSIKKHEKQQDALAADDAMEMKNYFESFDLDYLENRLNRHFVSIIII